MFKTNDHEWFHIQEDDANLIHKIDAVVTVDVTAHNLIEVRE